MLNPHGVFFSFKGTTTESDVRKKRSGSHQPSDYLDETVARKRALSVASILTNTMEGLTHTLTSNLHIQNTYINTHSLRCSYVKFASNMHIFVYVWTF